MTADVLPIGRLSTTVFVQHRRFLAPPGGHLQRRRRKIADASYFVSGLAARKLTIGTPKE